MSEAVLAFQFVIFLSLLISRVFAKNLLVLLCVGWSALTLVLVQTPALMILQLAVVWGAYSLLKVRNENSPPKMTEFAVAQHSAGAIIPDFVGLNAAHSGKVSSLVATKQGPTEPRPRTAGEFFADVQNDISRKVDLSLALSPLKLAIDLEKSCVEKAMDAAARQISLDAYLDADTQLRSDYEEHHAKLTQALKATDAATCTVKSTLGPILAPSFKVSDDDSPEIRLLIDQLRQVRDADLRQKLSTVLKSDAMYDLFWEALKNFNQPLIFEGVLSFAQHENLRRKAVIRMAGPSLLELVSEKTARSVRLAGRMRDRGVPHLVHFTRIENLASILDHGICPPDTLQRMQQRFRANDLDRYDRQRGATSFSIAHPNEKLFYRWRRSDPASEWVVLLVDPAVIWTRDAAFCSGNAADRRFSSQDLDARRTVEAFDAMFSHQEGHSSREDQGLRPYDPTDVQAEVLILGVVPPELITGCKFTSRETMLMYRDRLPGRDLDVCADGKGIFGLRSLARRAEG